MNTAYRITITCILLLGINTGITRAEFTHDEMNYSIGEINHYIFYRSFPEQMKIGESYTIKLFLRNTGEDRYAFQVVVRTTNMSGSVGEFIYPSYDSSVIVLEKGESKRVEFNIAPIKPHIGKLELSADLYLMKSKTFLPGDYILLDHTSKQIRNIEPAFTGEERILIFIIIILIIASAILIKRYQN